MNYILYEISKAEKEHDFNINMIIQFKGSKNKSRNISITKEQLNKIKEVLKNG